MLRFIIWLSLLAGVSRAALDYEWPSSTSCISPTRIGQSTVCCDGTCPDGGDVDSGTGVCKHWLDPCLDPVNPPVCAGNQVYSYQTSSNIDTGVSCAAAGSPNPCNWLNVQYTYRCCDCPRGYVSLVTSCAAQNQVPTPNSMCVGCTGIGESLSYDNVARTYYCRLVSPTQRCNALKALADAVSAVGNINTFLSAVCPTNGNRAKSLLAAQNLYSIISAIKDYLLRDKDPDAGKGFTGSMFGATAGVVSAINSLALGFGVAVVGLETAEVTAVLGKAYGTMCATSSRVGIALAKAQVALDVGKGLACPKSKRSDPRGSDAPSSGSLQAHAQRDNVYNPCAEFVSYFPTDYTTAMTADATCDLVDMYSSAVTDDPTIGPGIAAMQQFCTAYQSSGNDTLLINFQIFVSAVQAAIPYCDSNNTLTLSTSSTSTASSSSSSVIAPSTVSITSNLSTASSVSSTTTSSSSSVSSTTSSFSSTTTMASTTASSLTTSSLSSTTTSTSSSGTSSISSMTSSMSSSISLKLSSAIFTNSSVTSSILTVTSSTSSSTSSRLSSMTSTTTSKSTPTTPISSPTEPICSEESSMAPTTAKTSPKPSTSDGSPSISIPSTYNATEVDYQTEPPIPTTPASPTAIGWGPWASDGSVTGTTGRERSSIPGMNTHNIISGTAAGTSPASAVMSHGATQLPGSGVTTENAATQPAVSNSKGTTSYSISPHVSYITTASAARFMPIVDTWIMAVLFAIVFA